MPLDWILSDIFMEADETISVKDSAFRKTTLPDWWPEPQLFSCPERKSAFDELNCALDTDVSSESYQKMEVIGHHDEVVQQVFVLGPVVKQNIKKQLCGAIGLEQGALSGCGGSDKESPRTGGNVGRVGMSKGDAMCRG